MDRQDGGKTVYSISVDVKPSSDVKDVGSSPDDEGKSTGIE